MTSSSDRTQRGHPEPPAVLRYGQSSSETCFSKLGRGMARSRDGTSLTHILVLVRGVVGTV
jgi:hypothetical protein